MIDKSIDMMLQLIGQLFPSGTGLPSSYYKTKKILCNFSFGFESIHACKYDCVLFRSEFVFLKNYPVCGENRYKIRQAGK